jgi:MoaA/NifB/PqqE/SkfB family radical SAM enzyme
MPSRDNNALPVNLGEAMEFPASAIESARPEALVAGQPTVSHPPTRDLVFDALTWFTLRLGRVGPVRRGIARHMEARLRARGELPASALRHPVAVEQDKIALGLAALGAAERGLARGLLGAPALRAMLRNLYSGVFVHRGGTSAKDRFRARHGQTPGDFLVISPGKACNLRCVGCYANSGAHKEKLDWATFERTVREAHDTWGTRVFVISGGEPLAWRGDGRSVLDLAERFPDCFFVMYTNGTLIDDAVAKRMGRLGNVSPALSIEGMKERTDARRGAGVFDKVLAAMERLRRQGVIIGVSLTATRENADEILSDQVVETFFDRIGASYAFVFHYMPIGRSFTLDLMMTPAQRLRLFERVWWLVRNRHIFIADFWNSATATNGCLAAGRAGGYFHVNWNGDVSPCVFFPYSPVNVREVFARGGTLDEVWAHPFFADIRRWQRDYGYREASEPCPDCGNWLAPCIIRDHHADFMALMRRHEAAPLDEDARAALADPQYHEGLERFGRELEDLAGPVWRERYQQGKGTPPAPMKRQ